MSGSSSSVFYLLCACLVLAPASPRAQIPAAAESTAPALMLAKVYAGTANLQDYWVSEKLDGVRAYWDGKQLLSRNGNVYAAPAWFTQDFPAVALDGELWIERGSFARLSGIVRRQQADHEQWRSVRFWVFDLPAADGTFDQRLPHLQALIASSESPYIEVVEQYRVAAEAELYARLDAVVHQGGEGLMLHLGSSHYRASRSEDLLKLKRYDDAEAVVVAQLPGQGKYRGMLGALLVESADGLRFKLGTGFSDAERKAPPAIGSIVTYQYLGRTRHGLPRFASFMRVRPVD